MATRPPHGWFAARYNELLRNMFVREVGDDLHLVSAIAPAWVAMRPDDPPRTLEVRRAATTFGPLNYRVDTTASSMHITLDPQWRTPPKRIVVHIPWFKEVAGVMTVKRVDSITLDPMERTRALDWQTIDTPALDYRIAVRLLLEKYHDPKPRYDYDYLFPTARPPRLLDTTGSFIDRTALELIAPGLPGIIRYTLDGTEVSQDAPAYTAPAEISATTTLRARTFFNDGSIGPELYTTLQRVEPIPAVAVENTTPGLRYDYYAGAWSALPDFAQLTPVRSGVAKTIDLDAVIPAPDDYAVRFTGYIKIDKTGVYRFFTTSDDGSRLRIHDRTVVDNDGLHGSQRQGGEIALEAGLHPIEVTFFEHLGAARLEVEYATAGGTPGALPANLLYRAP